jgi:starch synthase
LADTIQDGVTGFLFSELSPAGLMDGVTRAFESFGCKRQLTSMRRAAMSRSSGWQRSALRYSNAYNKLLAHRSNQPVPEAA